MITRELVEAECNRLLKPKGEKWVMEPHMEIAMQLLLRFYNPSVQFPVARRGYLLMGNPGRGKTLLMQAFNNLAKIYRTDDYAVWVESHTLAAAFARGGTAAVMDIVNQTHMEWRLKDGTRMLHPKYNIMIDDLGVEEEQVHEANGFARSKATNVMVQVFQRLQTRFDREGVRVYASTNLSEKQLYNKETQQGKYDARTYSRLKGLMDFYPLGIEVDSRDFRELPSSR